MRTWSSTGIFAVLLACAVQPSPLGRAAEPPELQVIMLFKVRGRPMYLEAKNPKYCVDDLERKAAIGYRLYAEEHITEAHECFEELLPTTRRSEATLMCGLAAARQGDFGRAESFLKEALRLDREASRWNNAALPFTALIWMYCDQSRFDKAEEVAVELTRLPGHSDERPWLLMAHVRRQRRVQRILRQVVTCLVVGVPVSLGVGYIGWRSAVILMARNRRPRRPPSQLWTKFHREWSEPRF
jgi:tetratricopeptide (TPR) repeat protein